MSTLQAAASGLWRAEETVSAAAPGKWIPSCAYNGFRVSRSNNRAKTLFMHTRVFSDLSLNHRHQCRGFRCKSSCSVLAMTISSSSSEKSCEEEESSSSSGSSHQRGAESKETEVVLVEASDLITTSTTASSLFQRHATAKTSSCIEDGKRNAAGFEKTDLFGQGISKLQLLGVAVETMENEDGNGSATREETQAEEFNGKEEFTDEDDEDEDLDDEEDDDDDGDDQFPPLKELEDLDEDRELRIAAAAAAALELSGNGDIQIDEGGEDRPVTEEELMYEEWKSQPYALTVPL
ncbi:unnamed protein product [Sphagnum jensenii]|uniref:Uncharacterized protein n=1 Tax=Sphagnum jensenii TaxID=128206 RepID=A0ABP0WML9_9BRYO